MENERNNNVEYHYWDMVSSAHLDQGSSFLGLSFFIIEEFLKRDF